MSGVHDAVMSALGSACRVPKLASQSRLSVSSRTTLVSSGQLDRRFISPRYSPHSQSAHNRCNDIANSASFCGLR